ncbi:Fibronectin type III domain-containing protein [Actinacidiphila yanglinensis]|uniref:Fibronectin type III domain-containing protein n=1 Tax=Actinacidiphila yanglinensis TaxID=310779 RepID=A0A1H5T2S1_9ACTN|nr:carbohydrate binding domain-containing protein [Actinacidiphila yanglinensis]SEF56381.1 Fibronectin type III domain-containing protein [Actinacidiphila yanglinensis]
MARRLWTVFVTFALLLFGSVALSATARADTSNLVANPGFESGGTAGWSCGPTASAVTSPVHTGTHALAAAATASDTAQCTQTVPVQPDSAYTLTAYVEGAYVYLGATGYSSTWTPSATSWQQLSTSFTTGASTTSVTLYLHGWYGEGTYDADDVSLTGPAGSGATAPATPTGLAVTGTTSSTASLSWNASAGATGYRVYQGGTQVASASGTSTTVSGLAAATSYAFSVSATNSAGESARSAAVSATTQPSGGGSGGTAAWHPSYLSIGSVYTPGSTVDTFFTTLASHGKVPDYGYEYLIGGDFSNWAATTTTMVTHARQHGMTPVLVDYGMNGNVDGTGVDFTNMQNSGWLTTYFTALKNAASAAAAAAPGAPVGWVIEPDMLGYLQQNYAASYGDDAANMPAATSAAYSAGVLASGSDPAFGNNLKGLTEAINYTIKKYDPSAFVGWQVNTWGVRDALKDTDTQGWTAGRQSVASVATQVADFVKTADIGYHADFIAFDQWGQDFGVLRDPNPAADIRYLNAAHWSNYLLYVQTVRQSLQLPAVLWQIPVGHLNSTHTPSPTYWNSSGTFPDLDDVTAEQDEDSASTFFFGDTFTSSGNNLAFYGSNPGADPKVSVNGSTVTWGSHIQEAAAAGVVAILFGAGTGTGTYGVPEMVGTDQTGPGDFGYWVTRTQSYLAAPVSLP